MTDAIYGRWLRYRVMALLIHAADAARGGEGASGVRVVDLVRRLVADGVVLPSDPTKAVSDCLRWEVRKGRAVRVGRGRYRLGAMPRSTRYWLLQKARQVPGDGDSAGPRRPAGDIAVEPSVGLGIRPMS